MLSTLATHDAQSLVITKPSFIWFGCTSVDLCTALEVQLLVERSSSFFVYMNNFEIIKSERSFGSYHQKESYWQKYILRNPFLNMKITTFEPTMKKPFCPFKILTKLKNSNYDKTKKNQIMTKLKNSNGDKTQKLKGLRCYVRLLMSTVY